MKSKDLEVLLTLGLITFFIFLGAGVTIAEYMNTNEYHVVVTDKQIKRASKSSDRYLIFTKVNGETRVFENTDAFFGGKFNSSDMYAEIQEGKKYTFKTIGFRVPFLSWHENIVEVKGE